MNRFAHSRHSTTGTRPRDAFFAPAPRSVAQRPRLAVRGDEVRLAPRVVAREAVARDDAHLPEARVEEDADAVEDLRAPEARAPGEAVRREPERDALAALLRRRAPGDPELEHHGQPVARRGVAHGEVAPERADGLALLRGQPREALEHLRVAVGRPLVGHRAPHRVRRHGHERRHEGVERQHARVRVLVLRHAAGEHDEGEGESSHDAFLWAARRPSSGRCWRRDLRG